MPRTYICPNCGQEFTTKAALEGHECVVAQEEEAEQPQQANEVNPGAKMQATIPMFALPPEIKYLSRGKLVGLRVMGKFDGDRVLIDDVKLL